MQRNIFLGLFGCMMVLASLACINGMPKPEAGSYDLNKPVKYNLSDGLSEISGIALYHGRPDSIYAQQDEDGKIFYFKPGDKKPEHSKFSGKGDYEDIAIMNDQVFILRSDGALFSISFKKLRDNDIKDVNKMEGLLPAGEFEGMYADEKTQQLYVLCKSCVTGDSKKFARGYILQTSKGTARKSGEFAISVKEIEALSGKKKMNFRPSALAKNLKTNEWYILSSVNKVLVITNAEWKVKAAYLLDPAVFVQPEGIAFDNKNNLYIANEGNVVTPGTVLKFSYKK